MTHYVGEHQYQLQEKPGQFPLCDPQPKVTAITVAEFEHIQHITRSEDKQWTKRLHLC